MSTRRAALGLAALVAGFTVLIVADGSGQLAGAALLGAGLVTVALALVRGVSDSADASFRAGEADHHRAAADGANLKKRADTGRWPPVIGGG